MALVKLEIDGKRVRAESGKTILEVARENGRVYFQRTVVLPSGDSRPTCRSVRSGWRSSARSS